MLNEELKTVDMNTARLLKEARIAQYKTIREQRKAADEEFRRSLPGIKIAKTIYEHVVHAVFAVILVAIGIWAITGIVFAAKLIKAAIWGN